MSHYAFGETSAARMEGGCEEGGLLMFYLTLYYIEININTVEKPPGHDAFVRS